MEPFKRKSPEEILASILKLKRGRLNILVGAVAGSGKTYHMLREGEELLRQGVDAVVSPPVEESGEAASAPAAQPPLETVAGVAWSRGEAVDLDVELLLERNPEVVLVDDLAHRNRPDAPRESRLEDIELLLARGISVVTTVNIYELEGAAALARSWIGLSIDHPVPARALELADEMRLIDVTPDTLLERAAEGANPSLPPRWLERGTLGRLRELALRTMAEGVNGTLEKHREELGLAGPSGIAERVLVAVQYHWNGSILVRRGQQVAKRLGGEMDVVAFVPSGRALRVEEEAFRRSIRLLARKVGASFEERTFRSRRRLPRQLLHFALQRKATRIVLGHSRQTPWQEWRRGSIANRLLTMTRNIDLLFVADRSDWTGERILPARSPEREPRSRYRRLTDQELKAEIGQLRRGSFKLYIGAAPGVGKTYAMLREGGELLQKGVDVVIGLLETHGREDTQAQVGALEIVPRRQAQYRGTLLEEMDVDAILQRRPEVALVDELAHTNIPGSERRKRWEDVIRLLDAGISVISTMNVQHLESLGDAVEQIAGVVVRETVPDRILRLADEVQLVDVSPKSLQARMKAGKIYAPEKVEAALGQFFKLGNLIALRELALRELADDVDERLESWDRRGSLRGPWRREEVIFVAVTASPSAERLIRRGFRIAYRLKAAWHVVYVHGRGPLAPELEGRLEQLRQLAERLGGSFRLLRREQRQPAAAALLGWAAEKKATQIIVGQPAGRSWRPFCANRLVRSVLREARRLDVLVVADYEADSGKLAKAFAEEETT
ncbi:Osmosensitive K+ channel histidine kinase KdpD [Paenibacillus pasadenensis]|uniref:Osmosensitive K+ channel histidine kinase KdpD n=1 Tax=Paenibacillus pasadenensis TaxID=217090 RepID=A0A2N5N579_9BACL|nr:histidine kinase [Paenibacillus pasadenensis]PLT45463.1 Osmosensitive K+ channel histidine kinase KdpD [Paenibacillus pasadenensis]